MQKERKTLVMGVGRPHEGFMFVFSVNQAGILAQGRAGYKETNFPCKGDLVSTFPGYALHTEEKTSAQ